MLLGTIYTGNLAGKLSIRHWCLIRGSLIRVMCVHLCLKAGRQSASNVQTDRCREVFWWHCRGPGHCWGCSMLSSCSSEFHSLNSFLHLTAIITVVLHSSTTQNRSIISWEKHKRPLYFQVCEYDFSGYTERCEAITPCKNVKKDL